MTGERRFGILVAVDDSAASERAVRYVADVVGARERFRVVLLHIIEPLPPEVLEHRGADTPEEAVRLDQELEQKKEAALDAKRSEVAPAFERARNVLVQAGFADEAIHARDRVAIDGMAIARQCLEAADQYECGTVCIGRDSLPWHRELVHLHVAEALVRNGENHTIWVVE